MDYRPLLNLYLTDGTHKIIHVDQIATIDTNYKPPAPSTACVCLRIMLKDAQELWAKPSEYGKILKFAREA